MISCLIHATGFTAVKLTAHFLWGVSVIFYENRITLSSRGHRRYWEWCKTFGRSKFHWESSQQSPRHSSWLQACTVDSNSKNLITKMWYTTSLVTTFSVGGKPLENHFPRKAVLAKSVFYTPSTWATRWLWINNKCYHGRPQDFFPEAGKLRVWGRKSPSGVQG